MRSAYFGNVVRQFFRRWLVEIVAGTAGALGIYLLVEQSNLSETLWARLAVVSIWIWSQFAFLVNVMRTVHPSDALGIGLLALAAVLLIRRTGERIQRSPAWSPRACPECGHSLRRARRGFGDVLTWFLPLRRFRCRNCGWTGLRAKPLSHEEIPEPLASGQPH